jgi:membrane-associated phospholipid phosphatase
MANVGRQINSSMYDRTYSVLGDPNPRAAMPSIHTAITFMLFLFALNFRRWIAVLALLYSLLMAFALVYTGEHYVVDAIVGAAITTYAYLYSGRWLSATVPIFATLRQARSRPLPAPDRRVARG